MSFPSPRPPSHRSGLARFRVATALVLSLTMLGCQQPTASGALVVPTTEPAPATATSAPAVAPTAPPPTERPLASAPASQPAATVAPVAPAAPAVAASPSAAAAAPAATSFSAERAFRDVEQLAGQIGSRVAGSPAQARAAEYLTSQFEAVGLQVERQTFTFRAFNDRGSTVQVQTPEPASVEAMTMAYSPGGEASAPLVYVGLARPDDFDPAAVRGKVALARRGEIRFGEKVANLSSAGALAVLIFNNAPGNVAGNLGSPGAIPTVSISQQDGERLVEELERGAISVRVAVDAESRERTGDNVIASKPGGQRVVVIGGHYDSVQAGPGANDNASGTATFLEVARVVATRQYPFTVRFIAFEAEELGLLGSAHYVRQLGEAERDNLIGMINLDMVGVGDRLTLIGDAPMVERGLRSAGQRGIVVGQSRGAGGGSASDHSSFQSAGIPAVFLYRGEDPRYHTAEDRPEFVSPANLEIAGNIVLDILDSLAADEPTAR